MGGRKKGRPPLDPSEKRGKNVSVWLTDDEYKQAMDKAEASGGTLSELFRSFLSVLNCIDDGK